MRVDSKGYRNAEKLFDWAGSNTFGASLDLSAVHSTAKEANELLRAAIIPILSKLSIVSAVTEVQDEQAKLQQEREKLQQEQQKKEQAQKQEEKKARRWWNRLYWLGLVIIYVIFTIAFHPGSHAAPEPASNQAPIAIPEPTPLNIVVSEPASNQAPMATPEPKRAEVERTPMRPPEPASSQAPTPVPEPSPTIEDTGQGLLLRNPRPPYPPLAVQMHISGDVGVRITVKGGKIVDAEGSGPPMLASATARWVKANWKFNPTANGTFTVPVSFVLGQ